MLIFFLKKNMLKLHQISPLKFGRSSNALPIEDSFEDTTSYADEPLFEDNFDELQDLDEDDLDHYDDAFPFSEGDLRFLRDFILSSATYVEELESLVCDSSEDFWEAREHAYRIVTAALINYFLYEMEETASEADYRD